MYLLEACKIAKRKDSHQVVRLRKENRQFMEKREPQKNPLALLITKISKRDYGDFSLFFGIFLICVIVHNRCNQRFLDFFGEISKVLLDFREKF